MDNLIVSSFGVAFLLLFYLFLKNLIDPAYLFFDLILELIFFLFEFYEAENGLYF